VIRFRFSKRGKVRFTSHRDVARMWERALRRAAVPVAYSEGFSPRPRLSFGLALPTGHESDGEYVDVKLVDDPDDLTLLCARLTAALPEGVAVQAAEPLAPGEPSLQEVVDACSWSVEVDGPTPSEARAAVERLLAAPELPVLRERKGKERVDDLRPALEDLTVHEGLTLVAVLATRPVSFRPAEVVAALDPAWRERRVRRTHQWITDGGARREPIPLATPSPHAEARAS
jgi:radical SAM-linked protein